MKNMCYNLSTKRKELTKNDNSFQKIKKGNETNAQLRLTPKGFGKGP